MSAQAEEEEEPYRNLRKRRNNHLVDMEDDEPNGEELNDESSNYPQKEGPYRNLRKRNRKVDLEVESDYEPNYGDGEMNDENLEEVLFDCAKHAKRKTVSLKDIQLARCIKYRREAC